MEYITLNNGVQMPKVGLGTFLIPNENIIETIGKAYALGYRCFDTAWRYHNEEMIAKALKVHNIPREDVFITTKVNEDALYWGGWPASQKIRKYNLRQRTVRMAIEDSFKNLHSDYIDLFLLHAAWPQYPHMWRILSELYKKGRIRAIGVSNFLPPHLDSLNYISDVKPVVNQFEISPLNTQKSLIRYCQDNDIAVQAMSTFSHYRSVEPRLEILESPIIRPIAEKYGKTIPQIVLRWLIQQDIMVIPKTWNEKYLAANINLFDFQLADEDMRIIDSMDQGKFLNYNPYPSLSNIPMSYPNWSKWIKF